MHIMPGLAVAELKGLKAEKALTQKFRAPQSHAVLEAALHLAREVGAPAPAPCYTPLPLVHPLPLAPTPLALAAPPCTLATPP